MVLSEKEREGERESEEEERKGRREGGRMCRSWKGEKEFLRGAKQRVLEFS